MTALLLLTLLQADAVQRQALLRPVCGSAATDHGCEVCPAGTDFPTGRLDFQSVFYGHFLGPASDDAAVGFLGCYSHASGLGGALVLTRKEGAWKFVKLYPGFVTGGKCQKLRARDSHDVLVCRISDLHQGYAYTVLTLQDFSTVSGRIFFNVGDGLQSCVGNPVESGQVERVDYTPTLRGTQITVRALMGTATLSDAEIKDCGTYSGGDPARLPYAPRLDDKSLTYRFLFDGSDVKPMAGNPPMTENGAAVPPKVTVIHPFLYTATDHTFKIKVPAGYKISACRPEVLVCFVHPKHRPELGSASLEVAELDAKGDACLNPQTLPGSNAVRQKMNFSQQFVIDKVKWPGGYFLETTNDAIFSYGIYRTLEKDRCYAMATHIVSTRGFSTKDRQALEGELSAIAREFRFLPVQDNTQISPKLR